MNRQSLRIVVALLLAACALVVAGCGEKSEEGGALKRDRLDLALDFFANPDHAGIYQALDAGYFSDAGLDVKPRVPSDLSAPIKQVAAGRVDLAISYEPEVFLARERGLDVVAVAALAPEPLTSLIWLPKSKIRRVRDLKGKRVATAGIPYQSAYLRTILERAGLAASDAREVNVGGSLLPAILSGRAGALLGGFRNVEGVELKLRGKRPRVIPVDRLGVPTYDELVLVARGKRSEEDTDAIRRFIAALARGTRRAKADPASATRALLRANRDLDPKITRASVRATLPLLSPVRSDRAFGFMDARQWASYGGWLLGNEIIKRRQEVGKLLTNSLLPGPRER